MTTQCCLCYRVKETVEEKDSWRKVRQAAIVSRTARLTFCPECELKFRARYGLLPSQNRKLSERIKKASRRARLKKAS